MKLRSAFTMIELMFVIVVLGILAMVAIPRMSGAINDANLAKARSDVAALRSAIASERQTRFLQGDATYVTHLDQLAASASSEGDVIFDSNGSSILLTYGMVTGGSTVDGKWRKTGVNQYTFRNEGVDIAFTYYPALSGTHPAGEFTCDRNGTTPDKEFCKRIVD